jgi:hypothetical protein
LQAFPGLPAFLDSQISYISEVGAAPLFLQCSNISKTDMVFESVKKK